MIMHNIAQQLRAARLAAGFTQEELAQRMGTQQGSIARLENPEYRGHTLSTIMKYAQACGQTVHIDIVDRVQLEAQHG